MKTYLVHGVPRSLQLDAWWMSPTTRPQSAQPRNEQHDTSVQTQRQGPFLVLLALVFLGDVLLWQASAGASVAVFGWAIVMSVWALTGVAWVPVRSPLVLVVSLAGALPVLEEVQFLSVAFCMLGVSFAVVTLVGAGGMAAVRRLWAMVPLRGVFDLTRAIRRVPGSDDVSGRVRMGAALWAVPIGLGLIFAALLIESNPMLENWVASLPQVVWPQLHPGRLLFWAGLSLLVWPCLVVVRMPLLQGRDRPARVWHVPGAINAGSVVRSLLVFNALFAVQTVLDITYLWSGTQLPAGLSHAEYAHRGAYPLLVTALLAGVFAVVSRPFTLGDALLRAALMMWVAQTVLLVVSSMYRLELYVETYGLTRLRLAAALWMGCVAFGLALVLWQVWKNNTAPWLVLRSSILGVAVLYAACFISFDGTIARYNLGHDVPLDRSYLCALGDAARPAILGFEQGTGMDLCGHFETGQLQAPLDWREWGFRGWRVRRSLAAMKQAEAAFR